MRCHERGFQRRDAPIVHNLPTDEGTGSFTYFRSTMNQDIKSVATLSEAADLLGLTHIAKAGVLGESLPSPGGACVWDPG